MRIPKGQHFIKHTQTNHLLVGFHSGFIDFPHGSRRIIAAVWLAHGDYDDDDYKTKAGVLVIAVFFSARSQLADTVRGLYEPKISSSWSQAGDLKEHKGKWSIKAEMFG